MSNITIVVFLLLLIIWIYSLVSVFTSEFVDDKQKVFWRVGILFVPPLALFYLFMKRTLLK